MSANPATGHQISVPPVISPPAKARRWIVPVFFAVLTFILFGDALLIPGRIPVDIASDLRSQYLFWRQFGFDQIRAGHFPLWNPNQFSGTPFFADPQSAMLYPPNWLHLILSPDRAASWLVALHFFLAGFFTARWLRSRGRSLPASLLGGTIYACSGPIITNLRPGHLPLLCSAAWAPLLFHCVDGIFDSGAERRSKFRAMLIGAAIVAFLAVDGYPQYAYYSGLAVGLYAILRLDKSSARLEKILWLATMFAFGAALAAAQILASAQVAGESIRAGGLPYWDASAFSLPPENFLTLIVPGIFGDAAHFLYYGRWYWWETCLFIGPAAVALAVFGAPLRRCRIQVIMVIGLTILALGLYTPLYKQLYLYLPGFSSFRATARFSLLGLLFVTDLAAAGWDDLLAADTARRRYLIFLITATGLCAATLALAAVWAMNTEANGPGDFTRIIQSLAATYQMPETKPQTDPTFPASAASFAAGQLAIAAVATLLTAIFLALAASKKPARLRFAAVALASLTIVQLIIFDLRQRTSSDHNPAMPAAWADALAQLPPDGRALVCSSLFADDPAIANVDGSNPLIIGRTARFLAATQGDNPMQVSLYFMIHRVTPIYRIFRCGVVIPERDSGQIYPLGDPLPRLLLLNQNVVISKTDDALRAVLDKDFDPIQSVVLESPPNPAPQAGPPGSVRLINQTTDELEIEADLSTPQILLVTDAYNTGWHVIPLENDSQSDYQVMPGDYCLRAIPLAAGHHHFRLEYRPAAYVVGKWISIFALAAYLVAIGYCWKWRTRPAGGQIK